MSSIRVSKKHGVNPTLLCCPLCHSETGELALLGMLPGDKEAPRHSLSTNLCKECKEWMDGGAIILVECAPTTNQRTGRKWGVRQEAVERMLSGNPDLLKTVLEKKAAFVTEDDAKKMGLHAAVSDN